MLRGTLHSRAMSDWTAQNGGGPALPGTTTPCPKRRDATREDAGKAAASGRKALDLTRMHDVRGQKRRLAPDRNHFAERSQSPCKGETSAFRSGFTTRKPEEMENLELLQTMQQLNLSAIPTGSTDKDFLTVRSLTISPDEPAPVAAPPAHADLAAG